MRSKFDEIAQTPRIEGGRFMPLWVRYAFALLIGLPVSSFCATINIGLISFDVLIPAGPGTPGVNVLDISNFTGDPLLGGFALPPDFPAFSSLKFLNAKATFMGGSTLVVNLGDIAPGTPAPLSI